MTMVISQVGWGLICLGFGLAVGWILLQIFDSFRELCKRERTFLLYGILALVVLWFHGKPHQDDPWAAFNPQLISPQPTETLAHRCGKDPTQKGCGDVIPEGWVVTYVPPQPAKPAAIPAPPTGTGETIVPDVPPVPAPQGVGWDVDDTSGPWSEEPMRPPSARADRLLRRLHKAQGLEVGP